MHPRATNDFYIEPISTVLALRDSQNIEGSVYDPACGTGTILKVFKPSYGSDIVNRNPPVPFVYYDFLSNEPLPVPSPDNVISNPPYNLAEPFLHKSLSIANKRVIFLLRLSFLESSSRLSTVFRGKTPLRKVIVSSTRVNMPPGDLLLSNKVSPKGGMHAYAWFMWEIGYDGLPELEWI